MTLLTVKSNGSSLRNVISDFTSLFFPEYCLGCSSGLFKGEEILCTRCLSNLPRTGYLSNEENPVKEKFIGILPLNPSSCISLKNTQTQTRKTRVERWENVELAFSIKDTTAVENKRVLLVDDVITTGATLEACGRQILNSGCKELSIACIAEAQ